MEILQFLSLFYCKTDKFCTLDQFSLVLVCVDRVHKNIQLQNLLRTVYLSSLHVCVQMNVERRLFSFRFGDTGARMNWVHVDNLVMAHKLASEALTPKRSCVAVSHITLT